jgi:hypothetical protein
MRRASSLVSSFAADRRLALTILYLRLAALIGTDSLRETGSIFNAETRIYRVQMSFDCAFANPQLARNYLAWMPGANKGCNFALAIGQIASALSDCFPLGLRHSTVQDVDLCHCL